MDSQTRAYRPYISPFDPCPPELIKTYNVPPNLFMGFQPPNLPQYSAMEALKIGILWPVFYSPYDSKKDFRELGDNHGRYKKC